MRRMLDPTKVGGSVKLYCHTITLSKPTEGYIVFNYYTTKSEQFTIYTLPDELNNKYIICNGNIKPDINSLSITITGDNGRLLVRCMDKSSTSSSNYPINYNSGYNLIDQVVPVD